MKLPLFPNRRELHDKWWHRLAQVAVLVLTGLSFLLAVLFASESEDAVGALLLPLIVYAISAGVYRTILYVKFGHPTPKEHGLPPRAIKVGKYSKQMNISALLWLIAYSLGQPSQTEPDTATAMAALSMAFFLMAALLFLYSSTRLSLALGSHYRFFPIALIIIVILPFFMGNPEEVLFIGCLPILLLLTWGTREALQENGLKMGFLGPKEISIFGKVKH